MSASEIDRPAPIYVVSGGTGATGELLVRTVLAQFRDVHVSIVIRSHVHDEVQVDAVVEEASGTGGSIVHTMVNGACRRHLIARAAAAGIFAFDMVTPLMEHLQALLQREPLGVPGLYRQLHRAYFDRIEAIEFAVAHDDGQRPEDLPAADVILLGVSRVGKTPLSMYLSMLGWKVANVPLIPVVPPPDELALADPHRIVGLVITPLQLIVHRRWRQCRTGIPEGDYVSREQIAEELRAAKHYFAKQGYPTVDTTDKPIESCAEEVIAHVSRWMSAVGGTTASASVAHI